MPVTSGPFRLNLPPRYCLRLDCQSSVSPECHPGHCSLPVKTLRRDRIERRDKRERREKGWWRFACKVLKFISRECIRVCMYVWACFCWVCCRRLLKTLGGLQNSEVSLFRGCGRDFRFCFRITHAHSRLNFSAKMQWSWWWVLAWGRDSERCNAFNRKIRRIKIVKNRFLT